MEDKFDALHHKWIQDWAHIHRAQYLLVFHTPDFILSHQGKGFKTWCKLIRGRGYDLHTWHIDASKYRAAKWYRYMVSFCYPLGTPYKLPQSLHTKDIPRPCCNANRTYGIPNKNFCTGITIFPFTHPTWSNVMGKYRAGWYIIGTDLSEGETR